METVRNPPYRIVGIRKDGSELKLADGYPSRGWCVFASATKIALDASAAGNPEELERLELRDARNKIVPAHANRRADLAVNGPE